MADAHAVERGYAGINGTRLYYEIAGTGAPLVLIHAGIADCRMWDDQFAVFARRYRTIRYDLRGFGRSVMPPGPYRSREDLRALMEHLGVERAHLVGLSIGGGIALDFALDYPDRATALVLAASGVSGMASSPELEAQIAAIDATASREGIAAAVEQELRLWVDGPHRGPDAVDASVRARMREMDAAVFAAEHPGTPERLQPPAAGRLREVRVPTLVLYGDGDVADIITSSEKLAAEIAGARSVVVPGAAHMVNMEEPAIFNRAVRDFLAAV